MLIVDPGSTHMGRLDHALAHISMAANAKVDIIKFQMLSPKEARGGNIELPLIYWEDLKEHAEDEGIEITASVFSEYNLDFLLEHNPKYIKLSYSKKHEIKWIEKILKAGITPIVSCDVLTERAVPAECIKLYCIPEYPVPYEIAFDGLFPRFDGFSDHTLGIRQTQRAIDSGARIIEKHVTLLDPFIECPDDEFAVSYLELRRLKWPRSTSTPS